ncbi:3'-5' exonuclease [Streptacidiphilus monticola]
MSGLRACPFVRLPSRGFVPRGYDLERWSVLSRGIAVVDVEASGRSPWRHRVVEVGVVLLDYPLLRTEDEFSTLVDPRGPSAPPRCTGSSSRTSSAPPVPGHRAEAPLLLRGRVVVGHHVRCDEAFLQREFARIGIVLPELRTLCTMALTERALGSAHRGRSLAACLEAFGLPPHDAHTALGDARATADLFRRCVMPARAAGLELGAVVERASALNWPTLRARSGPTLPRPAAYAVPYGVLPGSAGWRDARHSLWTNRTSSLCTRSQTHSLACTAELHPQEHRVHWPIHPQQPHPGRAPLARSGNP